MTFFKTTLITVIAMTVISGCKQNPKELGTFPVKTESGLDADHKNIIMDVHQIKIEEASPTSKYLYLRVKEGDRSYWIATRNSDVKVGEVYYYNEALVKANFESKEMEKVFDTLYLVTQLIPEDQGENLKLVNKEKEAPVPSPNVSEMTDGHHTNGMYREARKVSIGELLSDPESLEGKMIEVHGVCTKINAGILGRNWIHLQDIEQDKNKVVVTSQWEASPGDKITVRALVALNKDFGAGYTYDVLLEKGILVR